MNAADAEALVAGALELALRGRGQVEPNPRVGALALQHGAIVGRGWHRFFGGPHAELEALADAAEHGARPDALVVTLEPCSSARGTDGKKTPPCTDALLAAGLREVVVGVADQDPRHQGRGLAQLRAAGIAVQDGVLPERCRAINRPFARWLGLARPWTVAKWAMTLDGKTAAASGDARWISGEAARTKVHELRARVDAVAVGFRTARADDPELTVRHVAGPQPVRLVVDPRAELELRSRLVATARAHPLWLLVRDDADPQRCARLAHSGALVIACAAGAREGTVDLDAAWRELRRRGLRRVLVEGGGELLAQLVEQDCVDQVLCFVAPKLIGGRAAPTPLGGDGKPRIDDAWRLDELYTRPCGDDVEIGAFVLP